MNILSLSLEYPNPAEPGKGLFIWWRLRALSKVARLIVVSPVALLDYANPDKRWFGSAGIPRRRTDGGTKVLHPRWLYPPLGGAVNAFCLAGRLLWPLFRLQRTFSFDLVDAHFGHPDGIAAALVCALLGKPFFVTLRGSELWHQRSRLRRYWMGWAIRRAARVITMSDELRDFAVTCGADPARVKVIPNGINKEVFFPRGRSQCRAKLGIDACSRVILSAGDLAEGKGHQRVIQAVRGLRDEGVPAELIIAGGVGRSGRYSQTLHRQVAAAGLVPHVRFAGELSQKQLSETMSAADVFCLASAREGWPNVVHESLACGTPVVATDVGSVRRLIPHGAHGRVVPVDSPNALQSALADALTHPFNHTLIAAWGGSRSWEDVANEVMAEMRQAIAEKAGKAKAIIVNADDLGINTRVNEAIFDLMARRRITSATLMANGPALEDAVRQLRNFKECSFGIHLNLTEFEPVRRDSGSKLLTGPDGRLYRGIAHAKPSMALLRAMYEELCAQVSRLLSLGVPLSHIDSHNHIHTVPFVFPVVKAVQRRYGIRKIRISKNIYSDELPCSPGLAARKRLYNWTLRKLVASQTTQGFTDLASFCEATRKRAIGNRVIEIMVHPGSLRSVEETVLLESGWEEELPFPVRLINYNELGE